MRGKKRCKKVTNNFCLNSSFIIIDDSIIVILLQGKTIVRKKNTQLADRLGVCSTRWSKNPAGNNRSLSTSSSFVDHRSLSIFGNSHELDYVPDEYVIVTRFSFSVFVLILGFILGQMMNMTLVVMDL